MFLKSPEKLMKTLLLVLFILQLAACSKPQSDEARILQQITKLQSAIENHSRSDFMAVIDGDYYDRLNTDRKSLQRMLMGFFLRYRDIAVFVTNTTIDIQQIRAQAQSQVVVSGGAGIVPDKARHYQVSSCWKKVSDEWLLSCLEWE